MSVLNEAQRAQILVAVEESYLDLRWVVGDHPDLLRLLDLLARRMFLAGLNSQDRPANPLPTRLEKP